MMSKNLSLFEYHDYRKFLRDYYEMKKAKDKKFSFRFFSRLAGFSSSGAVLKVMNGTTNLSPGGAAKISAALKFNREEFDFFVNLVGFNQATSPTEKQKFAEALLKSRTYRKIHPLTEMQYSYFSKWYYPVVRELVLREDFKEDPRWIAEQLQPALTEAEAAEALDKLIKLGVLKRDRKSLVQDTEHVTSGDEVSFTGAVECHRQFLARASESIDSVPRELRDLSTMTIGVSQKGVEKIKQKVQEFRKEIMSLASETSPVETVYLMNIQLFPAVKPIVKGKGGGE